MPRPRYTDEELLTKLRDAIVQLGRPPTVRELTNLKLPDVSTYRARFQRWEYAVGRAVEHIAVPENKINVHQDLGPLIEEIQLARKTTEEAKNTAFQRAVKTLNKGQRKLVERYGALEHKMGHLNGMRQILRRDRVEVNDLRQKLASRENALQQKNNHLHSLHQHNQELNNTLIHQNKKIAKIPIWQNNREMLTILRERDQARERVDRLENMLAQMQQVGSDASLSRHLTTQQNRERWVLLAHFRMRLRERFDLQLSYPEVSQLDVQLKQSRVTAYTSRGTPMKFVELDGHEVFCVVTPDVDGNLTLTTAYTRGMWEKSEWF